MLGLGLGLDLGKRSSGSGPAAPTVPAWVLTSGVTTAAMDIDFIENQAWLDPDEVAISALLACSRASQKWIRNSTGTLTNFANNALPYTDLGLFPESASTYQFLHSQGLTTANWTGSTNVVVTENSIAAPDGATVAELVTDSNTGGAASCHVGRTIVLSGAGDHAISIFAKAGTAPILRISTLAFDAGGIGDSYFNLTTGAITSVHANHANARITAYANGWYRCSLSFSTTTDLNGSVRFALATTTTTTITSDGTKTFYLWQAQIESGTRATSIIPTTTGAVTRAADIITFSDLTWFDGATDSFYAEWTARNVAGLVVWAWDATNDKALDEQSGMSPRLVGATTVNTALADTTVKVAGRLALNNFAIVMNDGAVATDTSETAPGTLTASRLGCDLTGANHIGSFIHRIASFDASLGDAALQALADP